TAALYEIRATLGSSVRGKRPLAIGRGPEGDPYLPANLLAEMALTSLAGKLINLCPDAPLASFRAAPARNRPTLLWLSASYLADVASFLDQYRRLYQEASRMGTAVAVGGRAPTEEVRAQMSDSTFGDGMTHLAAFARFLDPVTRRPRRGR